MSHNYNKNYYIPSERTRSRGHGSRYAQPTNNQRRAKKNTGIKKLIPIFLVVVAVIILATVMFSGKDKTKTDTTKITQATQAVTEIATEETTPKISYTKTADTTSIPKSNDAKYAIVINKTDGTIVAQRNAHKKTYPASTTKIMTLLVAAENIKDMDKKFTMTYEITDPLFRAEASVAGFLDGEKVSIKDLMYGTILPSGADAAIGLAIMTAGNGDEFVKLMNKKVQELGLENTHFTNVTGLHHKDNYSTAYDMAIILDAAMQNDLCKEILSTYHHTTSKTKQHPKGIDLYSTLFSYMYGTEPETATIEAGKTGYVYEAGYCIASYGTANDTKNEYIVVTFDNSSKWPAFHGQIDLYKNFAK